MCVLALVAKLAFTETKILANLLNEFSSVNWWILVVYRVAESLAHGNCGSFRQIGIYREENTCKCPKEMSVNKLVDWG
jgi:hypothetical protein